MVGSDDSPIAIPITGELDLHTFQPADAAHVMEAYFDACRKKGILQIRVIHGKGTGSLRESVRRTLKAHSKVKRFWTGDASSGGWGATHVELVQ